MRSYYNATWSSTLVWAVLSLTVGAPFLAFLLFWTGVCAGDGMVRTITCSVTALETYPMAWYETFVTSLYFGIGIAWFFAALMIWVIFILSLAHLLFRHKSS